VNELINGILLGGLYAAVSLGLTLVFGVMRLVNLAHGEWVIGAAYLSAVVTSHFGLDPLTSLVIAIPVVMLIGYVVQRGILNQLLLRGSEPPLVATFGIGIIAQAVFTLIFTGNVKSLNAGWASTGVTIFGETVRTAFVICFGVGVFLVLLLQFGLMRTSFGSSLRAAAEDPEAAESIGINVRHVYALTMAIAAALSAVAGILLGATFSMTPLTGLNWLCISFTVIVLGGLGSPVGALVGGVVTGLVQTYTGALLGPNYNNLVVYGLLVVCLVVLPRGIIGRKSM
jgi:branched-chain amino acid transport system permease protein